MEQNDDKVKGSLTKGLEVKSISSKDGDDAFIACVKDITRECSREIEFYITDEEVHPLIEQLCMLTESKAMEEEYKNILDMAEQNHMNALQCNDDQIKMLKILVNNKMWNDYIQYGLKEYIKLLLTNKD